MKLADSLRLAIFGAIAWSSFFASACPCFAQLFPVESGYEEIKAYAEAVLENQETWNSVTEPNAKMLIYWRSTIRHVSDRAFLDDVESSTLGVSKAERISGFMESNFNVVVPTWWTDRLAKIGVTANQTLRRPDTQRSKEWNQSNGILLSGFLGLHHQGNHFQLVANRKPGGVFSIKRDVLRELIGDDTLDEWPMIFTQAIVGDTHADVVYLSKADDIIDGLDIPSKLIAASKNATEPLWSSQLVHPPLPRVTSGVMNYHGGFAEITADEKLVAVFVDSPYTGLFLNIFDSSTGKRVHAFFVGLH